MIQSMRATARCVSCKQTLNVDGIAPGSRVECPKCHAIFTLPAQEEAAPRLPQKKRASSSSEHVKATPDADPHITAAPGEARPANPEEDLAPYVVEKVGPTCSECGEEVAESAVACIHCGNQFEVIEPPPPPPLKRVWDGSPSFHKRLQLFAAYEVGLVVFGLTAGLLSGTALAQLAIYFVIISLLAAFVMGTFDRVELTRTFERRVTLTKVWRIGFIPLKPQRIVLRDFESVGTKYSHEHDFFDWAVLVWLFSLGCVPGVVWFFAVFSKPSYHVALMKDHGLAAQILYSGRDVKHMEDIAATVSDVCRYRLNRAH